MAPPKKIADRKNIRLDNWDYGNAGAYFITIVTSDRTRFFGEIDSDSIMKLSPVGEIADQCWLALEDNFQDLVLGSYQVMPDHFHGIFFITNSHPHEPKTDNSAISMREARYQNIGKHSVFSIIGAFKSAVTRHAREIEPDFGWQRRYHDRIIRNEQELNALTKYVLENPKRWADRQSSFE